MFALQIFPPCLWLIFHSLNSDFQGAEVFNFDGTQFIFFFSFMDCALGIIYKKSSLNPRLQRFCSVLYFGCLIVFFSFL